MRLILTAMLVAMIGVAGCGRKGKLERVDPDAAEAPQSDGIAGALERLRTREGE